jgi:PAS domain S-box-containing protein
MGRHSGTKSKSEDIQDQNASHADLDAYRRFFEQSLDALFIVARDGLIVEASRSATDLLRYSKRQIRMMSLREAAKERWDRD